MMQIQNQLSLSRLVSKAALLVILIGGIGLRPLLEGRDMGDIYT